MKKNGKPKIVFIGAGSIVFTRNIATDILLKPSLKRSTLSLVDIDRERLSFSRKCIERLIVETGANAEIEATTDRRKALKDADYVITTILAGDVDIFRPEIEIPRKYGVKICVGDTLGPAGVFRALRTIPVMLDICTDIERISPDAFLLNYTNPMSMVCRAIQRKTSVKAVGLCHSVQGIASMLARWIGADIKDIDYLCAGINHQAWFLEYKWKGKDVYPLIRKAITRKKFYEEEIVLCEIFKHLDYFVTESSGHNSEYNAWFRKREDLLKKYCYRGTGWNPGHTAFILKEYTENKKGWKNKLKKFSEAKQPLDFKPSNEYASFIFDAIETDEPFKFNGNVANKGLIPNLPPDSCVEVPVIADRRGFQPLYVGELPPQLAALNNVNIAVQEMAVEAALTGNKRLVFHACCYDPLTSAVLSLPEIEKMVNELFRSQVAYLPQFKKK